MCCSQCSWVLVGVTRDNTIRALFCSMAASVISVTAFLLFMGILFAIFRNFGQTLQRANPFETMVSEHSDMAVTVICMFETDVAVVTDEGIIYEGRYGFQL